MLGSDVVVILKKCVNTLVFYVLKNDRKSAGRKDEILSDSLSEVAGSTSDLSCKVLEI